jgi:hypothetical protein
MARGCVATLLFAVMLFLPFAGAGGKGSDPKEALQALQDFIGGWKGSGVNQKTMDIWKESINWSWRFKGKDAWLTVDFLGSRLFKNGEIRWLPDKQKYQMTLVDKQDKKLIFEGELKKDALNLELIKIKTKDVRTVYSFSVRTEGRTLAFPTYQLAYTKEGESFGTDTNKKPECVVTGGLGTMALSYNGVTYYVCCSGCRDAFNEDPAKIIKQYLARKKAGK